MTEKSEKYTEALRFASAGGWRNEQEKELWASDYLHISAYADHLSAVDSANLSEAERALKRTQEEVDFRNCVDLKQELYFYDKPLAETFCRRDPQLAKMQETAEQLRCKTMVFQYRMKNATEYYSPEEAEAMARKELELPQNPQKTASASASVPDLFGKSPQEIAKITADMAPSKKRGKVPDLFGKNRKQIAETLEDL
jgi:hypothetical protein